MTFTYMIAVKVFVSMIFIPSFIRNMFSSIEILCRSLVPWSHFLPLFDLSIIVIGFILNFYPVAVKYSQSSFY